MARTNLVKHARKEGLVCTVCQKPIPVGTPYIWVHPRYRSKITVHEGCKIPISMTSSSKMVAVWEAQEAVSKAVMPEDIAQALHDLADTAREVGEEYQESCDNQREYFPDSEIAQENEEKAQELELWADEVESAAEDVDGIEVDYSTRDELESEKATLTTELDGLADAEENKTKRGEIELRLQELEDEIAQAEEDADEEALTEAQDKASIADECPA